MFRAQSWQKPLLPYERQLIELIGCTEEEYRLFEDEVRRRGVLRPAEYAHIPDIKNTGAEIIAIVSLVIGLASTAASYFLAPKPKPFTASQSSSNKQRRGSVGASNITGADRFAPTFGFDTQAELANYGEPIPILFARYDSTNKTGGIMYAPKLVWSRAFSHGTQQSVKMLFAVGEHGVFGETAPRGIDPPDLQGIFLGNGSLDSTYSATFAFYWKRNTYTGYRIKAFNLLHGTRAEEASGDPETNDDIFLCPTRSQDSDTAFSSSHSLSNNFEFGCYSPIANGTPFRLPWRIISILRTKRADGDGFVSIAEDDKDGVLRQERRKIVGNDSKVDNVVAMSGTGRNYSRRLGIIQYRDNSVSGGTGKTEFEVEVGKQIVFKISSNDISKDYYYTADSDDVGTEDITNTVNELRTAADEALQVGELFMVRRTVWQVVKRRFAVWTPDLEQDQIIRLKCVEILGPDKIGVVSNEMLTQAVLTDNAKSDDVLHVDTTFYPLMRVALAVARNTRRCDVTEIGLRSVVYQRLNGLTNFQAIPTAGRLNGADRTRQVLNTGQNNSYIRRTSAFMVYVRPAGTDENGNEYEWDRINQAMAVVGNNPTEQYNFLRFVHPEFRQYEFRFVPKNGADMDKTSSSELFWRLNATPKPENSDDQYVLSGRYATKYGVFTVISQGKVVQKDTLRYNLEFIEKGSLTTKPLVAGYPLSVSFNYFYPTDVPIPIRASALEFKEWYSSPPNFTVGRSGGFGYETFGNASTSSMAEYQRATKDVRETADNGQWILIRYTYSKFPLPAGHYSGQTHSFITESYEVLDSSEGFTKGSQFTIKRNLAFSNPFRNTPNGTLNQAGPIFTITETKEGVVRGRFAATWYEVFGPATNYSNGYRISATRTLTNGSKEVKVQLSATATDAVNNFSGQSRTWENASITPLNISPTTQNWQNGDFADLFVTVSASNPFFTPGATVGFRATINSIQEIPQEGVRVEGGRIFESQSQYADLTFYPGQVEKSNANGPEHAITYVNEITPNQLTPTYANMATCGLALKASRNYNKLDQLRFWLPNGVPVKRFHPDDGGTIGPSNLFCDLVYYLLTDQTAGLGSTLKVTDSNASKIINTDDFARTARFLKANHLFYDGVIGEALNLRQFINEMAPNFLCNFVISDGKFSLVPAVPTTSSGEISTQPVEIKQLFTSGNILEDTFEVEYLGAEERKAFQAVVRYREERKNQLPQERNVVVRWATDNDFVPVESFDATDFCTNSQHAELLARFFLSVRERITHTVRFATVPYGLDLAPGDFIKVATQASPYSSARNGVISSTGAITSVTPLSDGQYNVLYYKSGSEDVANGTITVTNNSVTDSTFFDTVFTVVESSVSENVYMVEQLTITEDNTVQIVASEFPCDNRLSSLIAQDLIDANRPRFAIES